jgi:hypothetical protein
MLKIIGVEAIATLAALIAYEVICIRDKLVVYKRHKFMNFGEEMARSMQRSIQDAIQSKKERLKSDR